MRPVKPVIKYYEHVPGNPSYLGFWCPACRHMHVIPFTNSPNSTPELWCFDGDVVTPTISPSLRVLGFDGKTTQCHVVITKGLLNYCNDFEDELAGKTIPMEPWEDHQYQEEKP